MNFIKIWTNILGKQANNNDQGEIARWPIVPHVAKLKINVVQRKTSA